MKKKNIELTIESIAKKYLIPEKMAKALLSQEPQGEQQVNDALPQNFD